MKKGRIFTIVLGVLIGAAFFCSPIGAMVLYVAGSIVATVAFGYGIYWLFIWPITKIVEAVKYRS